VEGNVVTYYCFRKSPLFESIHAGRIPFFDSQMMRLMLESSVKACEWLKFRDSLISDEPTGTWLYFFVVNLYNDHYINNWIDDEVIANKKLEKLVVESRNEENNKMNNLIKLIEELSETESETLISRLLRQIEHYAK
jgi:hypothetical protein